MKRVALLSITVWIAALFAFEVLAESDCTSKMNTSEGCSASLSCAAGMIVANGDCQVSNGCELISSRANSAATSWLCRGRKKRISGKLDQISLHAVVTLSCCTLEAGPKGQNISNGGSSTQILIGGMQQSATLGAIKCAEAAIESLNVGSDLDVDSKYDDCAQGVIAAQEMAKLAGSKKEIDLDESVLKEPQAALTLDRIEEKFKVDRTSFLAKVIESGGSRKAIEVYLASGEKTEEQRELAGESNEVVTNSPGTNNHNRKDFSLKKRMIAQLNAIDSQKTNLPLGRGDAQKSLDQKEDFNESESLLPAEDFPFANAEVESLTVFDVVKNKYRDIQYKLFIKMKK